MMKNAGVESELFRNFLSNEQEFILLGLRDILKKNYYIFYNKNCIYVHDECSEDVPHDTMADLPFPKNAIEPVPISKSRALFLLKKK